MYTKDNNYRMITNRVISVIQYLLGLQNYFIKHKQGKQQIHNKYEQLNNNKDDVEGNILNST